MEHTSIKYLKILGTKINKVISPKLTGVYLHGSLAMNFFDATRSDINLLIVVNQDLSLEEKEKIMTILYELDKTGPTRGIEFSVILEKHAKCTTYPLPFLLHYNHKYKELYLSDTIAYCEHMNGIDKNLTSSIMLTYHRGITLFGKPIKSVFKEPSKSHYLDSVFSFIKSCTSDLENESLNLYLNLVKAIAYLKSDLILSKGESIFWAKENFDENQLNLLNKISSIFLTGAKINLEEKEFNEFLLYASKEIKSLLPSSR